MALEVGDIAPDFTLESTSGEKFNLYKELEKGPILLNFYVGDFGINCQNYLTKFIESYGRIEELGVRMVPLNPDSLDSHKLWKSRLGAPFDFLFDENKAISNKFGAIVGPGFMVTGFTNREFFLVGKDKKILYTWKAPTPKNLPEVDEVVEGIKKAL